MVHIRDHVPAQQARRIALADRLALAYFRMPFIPGLSQRHLYVYTNACVVYFRAGMFIVEWYAARRESAALSAASASVGALFDVVITSQDRPCLPFLRSHSKTVIPAGSRNAHVILTPAADSRNTENRPQWRPLSLNSRRRRRRRRRRRFTFAFVKVKSSGFRLAGNDGVQFLHAVRSLRARKSLCHGLVTRASAVRMVF